MDLLSGTNTDALFVSSARQQQQLEFLANNALKSGIDLYQKKDYRGAARAFQGALSLAPNSSFSKDAAKYLAMAQLNLGKTDKAIEAYKTSIRLNPDLAEPHVDLAKLYFSEKRYKEAETEYAAAVRTDPSAANHYSLGQAYLFQNRYIEAEAEFHQVRRLEPKSPYGFHGLGLACSKQGRYEKAIDLFEEAIKLDRDFHDAYAEIGFAYADLGRMDDAEKIFDFLESADPDLADTLARYMYKVDPPKLVSAAPWSTFSYMMPRMTRVSDMDAYLQNANASKTFTMIFQFDKEMDRVSVEDRFNWKISRATGAGPGEAYNFGFPVASTEISITSFPDNVYWDEETMTARVQFTIRQNDSADGTIDPAHIEFKFTGVDKYGLSMDPDKDQYTGFSRVY
ncbi:MAG: tetratricopeptide repeat protein [Deltaproteobacteria bacterium]|nr:tetratricopeptide repeat protein [Deltaproteobacteria bacterium]